MDEKKTRYRTYTEDFKMEALELLKSSGKTARQIERELGHTWIAGEVAGPVSGDPERCRTSSFNAE